MGLNAADLDAITQEARACFLYEDAPEYLLILEQGMQRLYGDGPVDLDRTYSDLMRAAHSLKGGAGIAQLPLLQQVSHRLEDLLEALKGGQINAAPGNDQRPTAHELLLLGVEQIQSLVAQATQNADLTIATPSAESLMTALEEFLQQFASAPANLPPSLEPGPQTVPLPMLKMALNTDLEECLERVEQMLTAPEAQLKTALAGLMEECLLLGQTLNLSWLVEIATQSADAIAQFSPTEVAPAVIGEIRQQRTQFLQSLTAPSPVVSPPPPPLHPQPTGLPTPELEIPEPTPEPALNAASQPAPVLNLRIPVGKLDRISNAVGELLIAQERLSLYQSQIQQASSMLKKRTEQFLPIKDQVQTLYDRLATPLAAIVSSEASRGEEPSVGATPSPEFDALQFDRYTELHTTLLDFQELMARVQEIGADIDLLNRELQETLDQQRQQLNGLRTDLTDSRLIPFRLLAERFIPALQTLNQRYGKRVELEIIGADTLIDQAVGEQLKTPLIHLFRNAFDHGIESASERQLAHKPETAKICLSAQVFGNQVMVAIADDGRGINLGSVAQRAVQMGLCPPKQTARLSQAELLTFLFTPGFSTAAAPSSLSGRGVGLDVVKLQMDRLRGSIRVDTTPGQGTRFSLSIPLTLSILPVLLCQCQEVILAMPSVAVREIINLSEYGDWQHPPSEIVWQDQPIPLRSLLQLLPYQRPLQTTSAALSKLGIVIDVNGQPLAVSVDTLLAERELVIKAFDATVKVPPYLMGCSVLGNGQVIPVLSPTHFDQLLSQELSAPAALPPEPLAELATIADTILIVDDSIAVRRLLERVLTQAGYQVLTHRDGKEALDELNRTQAGIAMVISDIEMPRLDGYSLLQEIRTHPRWYRLPVAMLTSRGSDSHRQKAMELGATTYFTKPFQANELLSTLEALLD